MPFGTPVVPEVNIIDLNLNQLSMPDFSLLLIYLRKKVLKKRCLQVCRLEGLPRPADSTCSPDSLKSVT